MSHVAPETERMGRLLARLTLLLPLEHEKTETNFSGRWDAEVSSTSSCCQLCRVEPQME